MRPPTPLALAGGLLIPPAPFPCTASPGAAEQLPPVGGGLILLCCGAREARLTERDLGERVQQAQHQPQPLALLP